MRTPDVLFEQLAENRYRISVPAQFVLVQGMWDIAKCLSHIGTPSIYTSCKAMHNLCNVYEVLARVAPLLPTRVDVAFTRRANAGSFSVTALTEWWVYVKQVPKAKTSI